jgi:hypothetical protein
MRAASFCVARLPLPRVVGDDPLLGCRSCLRANCVLCPAIAVSLGPVFALASS